VVPGYKEERLWEESVEEKDNLEMVQDSLAGPKTIINAAVR